MITHSDSITKLMGAMLKVQGAVDGVKKDGKNPHFKSSYATLEAVVDTIRPVCQENGLVIVQAPGAYEGGAMTVETMIVHASSGEWIKSSASLPLSKQDPQGAGSALTYGERYGLMAMFNLPPVDDDGNAASERSNGSTRPAPRPLPPVTTDANGDNSMSSAEMASYIIERFNMAKDLKALDATANHTPTRADIDTLSDSDKVRVRKAYAAKKATFITTPQP